MRIIGGKFKGKKLIYFDLASTRPLRDFVKENIFNIISHSVVLNLNIKNTQVLDLYSGCGSFGFECISRNAKNVTFVEKNINATNLLKKNIDNLSIKNNVFLYQKNTSDFLNKDIKNKKYDIFFLDPPYANNEYINDLKKLKELKGFNKKNIVIIHRESNSMDDLKNLIQINKVKIYGRSKIIIGSFI
tara:strand:- start:1209 stop:1772 length:564 start_codon:yes stop_codon:yes gene_type:complete